MDVSLITGGILATAALLGAVTALLRELRNWKKPDNDGSQP